MHGAASAQPARESPQRSVTLNSKPQTGAAPHPRPSLRPNDRAHTGPPLNETLKLLAPLAPTLEKLDLSHNPDIGGTIAVEITMFTKLTSLRLYNMSLQGAEAPKHPGAQLIAHFSCVARRVLRESALALHCSRDQRVFSVLSQGTSRPRSRSARRCSRSIYRAMPSKVRAHIA